MPRKSQKKNSVRKDLSFKAKGKAKTKKKATATRVSKVPKTRNAGTWTEAQYWQRIRSSLRSAFRYWKPALLALETASRPYVGPRKLKTEYQCAECTEWFDRKSVEIDHRIECGSLSCAEDIKDFLERLTPETPEAFQILCKPCHRAKTKKYHQSKKAA